MRTTRIAWCCLISGFLSVGEARAATPQARWTHLVPQHSASGLTDVQMVSPTEVWACADAGVLIHSTDGGETWDERQLPGFANSDVFRISFVDPMHGWAGGKDLYRTVNGGATWTYQSSAIYWLRDLQFVDPSNGFASDSDDHVWRTVDGGANWASTSTGSMFFSCTALYFVDPMNGWVAGPDPTDTEVFRTVDGGVTWSQISVIQGISVREIQFMDLLEGWAISDHTLFHTVDGGFTWAETPFPAVQLFAMQFLDPLHGWLGTTSPETKLGFRTSDGGQTWEDMTDPDDPFETDRIDDVSFIDSQTGFSVGSYGSIRKTTDGGATWTRLHHGIPGGWTSVDAIDPTHAWGAVASYLIRTTDGDLWDVVKVPSSFHDILDVDFVDLDWGWFASRRNNVGYGHAAVIGQSQDSGTTWVSQYHETAAHMLDVEAIDRDHAFASGWRLHGGGSFLLRTVDGGETWVELSGLPSNDKFTAMDFIDPLTGWVTRWQYIHHTSDGGETWQLQKNANASLWDISMADALHGWAGGSLSSGEVLHTVDGGQVWSLQSVDAYPVHSIDAVTPDVAWIATRTSVLGTRDGGVTWFTETELPPWPTSPYSGIEDLHFFDAENAFVVGHSSAKLSNPGGCWRREWCPAPTSYCVSAANSAGPGAFIGSSGNANVGENAFVLSVTGAVANQAGLFYYGASQVQLPFGDGWRCVGTGGVGLFRLGPPVLVDGTGAVSRHLDFTAPPADDGPGEIRPGSTWYFQFWYRDPSFGGAGFNLSDGLAATFCL